MKPPNGHGERSAERKKTNMRRKLSACCFSLLALCCISAQAQEKTDGDTNGPVSDKIVQSMFYKAQYHFTRLSFNTVGKQHRDHHGPKVQ
jgi:hypothetical protein